MLRGDVSREAGRVVLVDDRPERRRVLREIFLAAGVPANDVGEADDLNRVAEIVEAEGSDVVVVERRRPITDAVLAITRMRDRFPLLRIVVCSFDKDDDANRREQAAGVDYHLDKPLRTADVRLVVDGEGRVAIPDSGEALLSSGANPSR